MRTCPTCKMKFPMNVTFCLQDGTPLVDTQELTEGAVVKGKYRILSKTGQGDMSIVYQALHLRLDEVRALKVMDAELARDPLFRKRFEQEALLTRKLQHANVVRVDDIDETEDGRPFMVMESVEGKTLKKVIQEEGPLPAPRACAIAMQVASALDAAHELGMIHRDIKPDNIVLMQTPSGERAKVLEFGMAKLKEARVGDKAGMLTLSGALAVIGTPQYMSPELAMGKRGDELDGRSDVYSLGIVMYEMLTGSLPFKSGTVMNMVFAHVQTPPKPILTVRPDLGIPEPVAAVVMKCLEKNRDSRPASGKALIEELERAGGLQPERPAAVQPAPPGEVRPAPPKPAPVSSPQAAGPGPSRPEPPAPAATAPAAQPLPSVDAVLSPPPKVPAAGVTAPAKRSRMGAIVGLSVALIVVAIGAWYTTLRPRNPVGGAPQATPSQQGRDVPASPPQEKPEVTQPTPETPSKTQESAQPTSSSPAESHREMTGGPVPARTPRTQRAAPPDTGKQIEAAAKLGDVYYENGQYDKAIGEYEKGLKLDPSNARLREKIRRTQTAKATEESLK
jgi:serine/threonine protein kinase